VVDIPEEKPYYENIPHLNMEKIEFDILKFALYKNNGNRKNTAKELGISLRTLYRKLNQYNLD
jgi:DNA-binding NtrC family response regulator